MRNPYSSEACLNVRDYFIFCQHCYIFIFSNICNNAYEHTFVLYHILSYTTIHKYANLLTRAPFVVCLSSQNGAPQNYDCTRKEYIVGARL